MFRSIFLATGFIILSITQTSVAQEVKTIQEMVNGKIHKIVSSAHLTHDTAHAHGNTQGEIQPMCGQYSYTQALMESNEEYRLGVEAARAQTQRIIAEFESGERAAPPVYTIPVVFHVIHKGEAVGSGTNISDAQVFSAIDALNRDYRRTNADGGIALGNGPDTEIQFCLAGTDPNGNATSGINRVNGTSVSDYASEGIISDNEMSVKALSNWDNRYYLNVWVVSEIDDNGADVADLNNFTGGVIGYSRLPTNPITVMAAYDGVVVLNLAIGNDPNGSSNFRLWYRRRQNRTLTHEVGHFLGLSHTFSDATPEACADGDNLADTPDAQQVSVNPNTCVNPGPCVGQQIENYMDYTPTTCEDQFTDDQTNLMRATLAGVRNQLVNTNNCSSANGLDVGISSISVPSDNLCDVTFTPTVMLYNYGSTTLTSVNIEYSLDAQTPTTYNWSGTLASGSSTAINLNSVTTTTGNHSFTATTVSGTLNGSNNDEYTGNDQSNSNFVVSNSGTQVTLNLALDCYGSETTWEIRNSSFQLVGSGGPYNNSAPNGQQIVRSFCLDEDCYDFTIFDSYNPPDGMSGAQYQDCNVNGDYEITDGNSTLVEMTAVNADFGASATHNFCVDDESTPSTDCETLMHFNGENYLVNPSDAPTFNASYIDNDQAAVHSTISGYSSNWMIFFQEVAPGDTNFFAGATSLHEVSSIAADNWMTFGPVTMHSADGELRWKHQFANSNSRDGYEVLVGTSGTQLADFNNANVLFSVDDNDPSTLGDNGWTQQSVSLPAGIYANQQLYFAIHHNALNQAFIYFDEIEVEGCSAVLVGLNDAERVKINVYPNPSSNNFTFTYSTEQQAALHFQLLNNLGQVVWSESRNGNSGREVIETSGLASGVYTFVVRSNQHITAERLILSK